jgi:hypothetical protein
MGLIGTDWREGSSNSRKPHRFESRLEYHDDSVRLLMIRSLERRENTGREDSPVVRDQRLAIFQGCVPDYSDLAADPSSAQCQANPAI